MVSLSGFGADVVECIDIGVAGLKDAAIAQQMQVSHATLERRLRRMIMMAEGDVAARFQLGALAIGTYVRDQRARLPRVRVPRQEDTEGSRG
ncbi:MAG: hypothetical protein ACYDAC_08150 [Candidatus Dormibacteria bacterium]